MFTTLMTKAITVCSVTHGQNSAKQTARTGPESSSTHAARLFSQSGPDRKQEVMHSLYHVHYLYSCVLFVHIEKIRETGRTENRKRQKRDNRKQKLRKRKYDKRKKVRQKEELEMKIRNKKGKRVTKKRERENNQDGKRESREEQQGERSETVLNNNL